MPCALHGVERARPPERSRVRRAIRAVVAAARVEPMEVSVSLIDDDEMRALNARWRGVDRATDVLSFAAQDGAAMPGTDDQLGDLVVSLATARRQARALGHALDVEIAVLVAHGLLHLLGLDHERGDDEAARQAELEMTFLAAAGYDPTRALIGRGLVGRGLPRRVTSSAA